MSSNNNDQNFEDESNGEHDFYRLVLAGCVVVVILTSFKEKKNGFMNLLKTLTKRYALKEGFDVPLTKPLAMILTTMGHGLSNRMIQERFQHYGESISRWF